MLFHRCGFKSLYFVARKYFSDQLVKTKVIASAIRPRKAYFADETFDRDKQLQLIQELIEAGEPKKATNMISHYGFDPFDFPDLIVGAKVNAIRYFAKNHSWFKVEEIFSESKEMLLFFAEELLKDENFHAALSIIKRHNLLSEDDDVSDVVQEFQSRFMVELSKEFEYNDNILFMHDDYVPTEEIINKDSSEEFWNLKDFNIKMGESIIWVDDIDSENFEAAEKELLAASIVGLDSEYRLNTNRFEKRQTSILQLATENKVYLFDVQSLGESLQYQELIWKLFTNPKIFKIGHSFLGDLQIIKNEHENNKNISIKNYLDIGQAYKIFDKSRQQYGLAYICEKILGKKMSKYEQVSNWSRRPLRKAQIHYAALDALLVIQIYLKMKEQIQGDELSKYIQNVEFQTSIHKNSNSNMNGNNSLCFNDEENLKKIQPSMIYEDKGNVKFYSHRAYESFFVNSDSIRFLVDNMCYKLAKYMRNLGQDTEYFPEKDFEKITELARTEKRVIVTRDKFYFKKYTGIPCFLLGNIESSFQLAEVIEFFKLKTPTEKILSRCVKCNHNNFFLLSSEEAKFRVDFKDMENYYKYKDFWECKKCRTIYWNGLTYQKAKDRFYQFTLKDFPENK